MYTVHWYAVFGEMLAYPYVGTRQYSASNRYLDL